MNPDATALMLVAGAWFLEVAVIRSDTTPAAWGLRVSTIRGGVGRLLQNTPEESWDGTQLPRRVLAARRTMANVSGSGYLPHSLDVLKFVASGENIEVKLRFWPLVLVGAALIEGVTLAFLGIVLGFALIGGWRQWRGLRRVIVVG